MLSDFVNSDDSIGKSTSKSNRIYPVFIKKTFKVDKNRIFLVKKWEIHVITSIFMITRSSERILNPIRYTGISNFNALINKQK